MKSLLQIPDRESSGTDLGSRTSSRGTIKSLTGLRFFAALAIVLLHYRDFIPYPGPLGDVLRQGGVGVSFFFVLSGFILTYNYSHLFANGVKNKDFSRFMRARFARVYPMHLVALLLFTPLGLYYAADLSTTMTLLSWLSNLLLLQIYIPISAFENGWNAPAWSIACEFFFYTAFPFFIFFITRWCKPRFSAFGTMTGMLIIGMLVFSVAVTCLFLMPPQFGRQGLFDYLVTRIPVVRIWEFFLGCSVGIAFLERQAAKEETGILSSWWGRSIGLVALGAILIGILLVPSPSLTPDMAPSLPTLITMAKVWVLCSPIFAGIIWLIASGSSIFSSILENRGLVLLGEASYSLYILHWLPFSALGVAETLGYSVSPLLATFVILGTIGVSIFGFRWIEVPARNILRPS